MYDSESLKVLCGNSIEEPEVDYDDRELETGTDAPVPEEASREYDFSTIIENMGKPDFKENYLEAMKHVRKLSLHDQQNLAFSIIQKMPEKYDFQFSITFDPFYSYDDTNELYKCIEFIEFDHEDFIVEIWLYLNPDVNSFNVKYYSEHNTAKILREIEEQLERRDYSEMIADFLRTYNKDKLIEWFILKSQNLRSSILIELMRKE
jgi:hypothetical protein